MVCFESLWDCADVCQLWYLPSVMHHPRCWALRGSTQAPATGRACKTARYCATQVTQACLRSSGSSPSACMQCLPRSPRNFDAGTGFQEWTRNWRQIRMFL